MEHSGTQKKHVEFCRTFQKFQKDSRNILELCRKSKIFVEHSRKFIQNVMEHSGTVKKCVECCRKLHKFHIGNHGTFKNFVELSRILQNIPEISIQLGATIFFFAIFSRARPGISASIAINLRPFRMQGSHFYHILAIQQ